MPDETATRQFLDLFNGHYVQPWHRKQNSSSIQMAPQPAPLPTRPNAEAAAGFSGMEIGPAKSQVKYLVFGSRRSTRAFRRCVIASVVAGSTLSLIF